MSPTRKSRQSQIPPPGEGGKFTLVEDQPTFDRFVAQLRRQRRFALDLEADSFHHYQEKICLIQVSFSGQTFLVDALSGINLGALARVFGDPRCEKVLHGADYDGRLIISHMGVRLRNFFDTMLGAQILGKPQVGLAALVSEYFQVTLDKRYQRADWSRRPLEPAQMEYAAKDVQYLLALRDALGEELEKMGRINWALEEFELLEAGFEALPGRRQEVIRIKGDRALDARQAAVLQSLLRWREGVARKKDVPPFKVIPNDMLLRLARVEGQDRDGLLEALTPRLRALYGDEIRRAWEKGRRSSPLELPREGGGGMRISRGAEKRLQRLKEWRSHFAHDLQMDPGVMLPNNTMEAVAMANPRDLADLVGRGLLKRWQLQLFGEAVLQILHTVPRGNGTAERGRQVSPGSPPPAP
jgi:ribonuclease D